MSDQILFILEQTFYINFKLTGDLMRDLTIRDLIYIALFTALLSVASIVVIPIGPVPISLQVFFFLLIPALLGPMRGSLSISLYIILGLIGIPVFAGGSGGLQSFLSPSFGYLIGAVVVVVYVGHTVHSHQGFIRILIHMAIAILILYFFGVIYQYVIMNRVMNTAISLNTILFTNLTVFLPIDLIKAFFAASIYRRLDNLYEF